MRYGRYNHQGYFGESFVRVLASAAGLVAGKQDIDVTAVDFSFDFPGSRGTTRYPKIEAQVKSWSSPAGSADMWHYGMTVDHFNDLAGPGYHVPRYLSLQSGQWYLGLRGAEQRQYCLGREDSGVVEQSFVHIADLLDVEAAVRQPLRLDAAPAPAAQHQQRVQHPQHGPVVDADLTEPRVPARVERGPDGGRPHQAGVEGVGAQL